MVDRFKILLTFIIGAFCGVVGSFGGALSAEVGSDAFLPTWKLMEKREQKEYFISGYLMGWRDAAKVTDIAIEYVESNPTKAVDGLNRIRSLYDVSGLQADQVVRQLDKFYSGNANTDASLSKALTSVKGSL